MTENIFDEYMYRLFGYMYCYVDMPPPLSFIQSTWQPAVMTACVYRYPPSMFLQRVNELTDLYKGRIGDSRNS